MSIVPRDILTDKTESEIRRAATWWFTAQEAFRKGEHVPLSIFALSVRDLTKEEIEHAGKFIVEHGLVGSPKP